MTAWHGDPELKERIVARMRQHRDADAFARGVYQERDGKMPFGYKGCAIGCLLDLQPESPKSDDGYCEYCGDRGCDGCVADPNLSWHGLVETQFGIDEFVASRIDAIFESIAAHEEASDFAVAVVEAIPVGADLGGVYDAWFVWEKSWDGRFGDAKAKLFELIADAPVGAVSDAG